MSANDVSGVLADQSEVLLDTNGENHFNESHDEQWQERESRNALKHVSGLGEMQDVTEVEYRKVRLERVVLVGVWSSRETTQAQAEESLRELAALAETAGAVVCDGLLQHRIKPDAATYVGSGKATMFMILTRTWSSPTSGTGTSLKIISPGFVITC